MRSPRLTLAVVLTALLGSLLTGASTAQAADPAPPFATILFGRTQWVHVNPSCQPVAQAVDLGEVADELTRRGLRASGAVVVNRTRQSHRECFRSYTLSTSWDDLARLRDEHGWQFVSAGLTYTDMRTKTVEQQVQESCGSLPAFEARGHTRAWGLFAYANNSFSPDLQRSVVGDCFAYGRTYRGGVNLRSRTLDPWLQKTTSVNGGMCHAVGLPCYDMPVMNNRRYTSPLDLRARFASVRADQWVAIQFYRLVRGSYADRNFSWDCTSPDWREHWTSTGELYCYDDFLTAVDGIPANAVAADPATVAEAWGRLP